jgi:hypothetical protein
MVGAILLTLGLAGCGRVGPLELPPGVTVDQAPSAKPIIGPEGTPVRPVVRKPLPMDWLLN